MQILWGVGGILVLLLVAFALSSNRRAIRPRTIIGALALQIVFAFIVLRWDVGKQVLSAVSDGVRKVIDSSNEGIDFLVGPILPSEGTVFAFQVLPIIVFVASLTAVLYHWRILQWVVRIVGGGLQKVLGTTKAESMNATANIFLGQTEAPLVVRPYLVKMSQSEFFAVMVGGLSTVAGSVMVGYALLGASLENLIAASFMAAPGGLLMAKIMIPQTGESLSDQAVEQTLRKNTAEAPRSRTGGAVPEDTDGAVSEDAASTEGSPDEDAQEPTESGSSSEADFTPEDQKHHNVVDAAASGASDGLKLALNVGAMLFAFVSLIALLNLIIGAVGGVFGVPDLTFEQILGYIFSPVMYVIGVPWDEAVSAGSFVGQKIVLNEFVAFADFGPQIPHFSDKTVTIVTFALTGFANFSSMAILLGGLGGLVPERRPLIAKLGLRAILAGTLANLLSAAIAGILVV